MDGLTCVYDSLQLLYMYHILGGYDNEFKYTYVSCGFLVQLCIQPNLSMFFLCPGGSTAIGTISDITGFVLDIIGKIALLMLRKVIMYNQICHWSQLHRENGQNKPYLTHESNLIL